MFSFFVILVLQGRKRDKLSLERPPFKPFNEWERKQDHSTIFSCLESLKRAQRRRQRVPFSYIHASLKKVIKVYLVTFSCFFQARERTKTKLGMPPS
jgi:hypothetical protein